MKKALLFLLLATAGCTSSKCRTCFTNPRFSGGCCGNGFLHGHFIGPEFVQESHCQPCALAVTEEEQFVCFGHLVRPVPTPVPTITPVFHPSSFEIGPYSGKWKGGRL